jgi:glycosyltransferase involved in cell wall biosynthesis
MTHEPQVISQHKLIWKINRMSSDNRQQAIQNKSVFISCVVPVFNEEANVESFFQKLQECLTSLTNRFEIVVVDDGSRDRTIEKILSLPKSYHIKLIALSRNFGKETALTAALEHATGDVAIIMDADFQHPIEILPQFLKHWGEGFEMVYGVRKNRDNESRVKRNMAHLFYWLMGKMTKIDIPNNAGDFRLIDRKVIDALNQIQERTRFMKGLYAWVGYSKMAVPFDVQDRQAGVSSWRLSKFVGFVVSTLALIYAVYFLTYTLMYGADLPGFPSIIVAVMFLGGVQLLSIGILGEYIARIFTEVKQRPKYLIAQKYGFDE